MRKNVAGQAVGAQMITAADGTVFTGAVTVAVTLDAGTQATGSVGAGACTHEGNGYHTYAPAQAETNGDLAAFTFIGTGAIAATVQIYTSFPQTGDNFARLGAPAGASVSADIAAVKVDTAAVKVKTDFLPSATAGSAGGVFIAGSNAATSITTALTANVIGNVTGNLSGSVGSVTGAVGSVTGLTASDVGAIKTKTDFLPSATAGAAGGVFVAGSNAATSITTALTANIIGNVTGNLSGSVGSVTADVGITQTGADKVWATVTRLLTAGTNIVLAKGVGVTGFNDLDAAGVRTAVGLASANLDTQLDALPTAAENADANWDEAIAGHLGAGSTGAALNAAGSAGDPWTTVLPGIYGAGTAGKIVGSLGTTLQTDSESPSGGYQFTATALELAPTGGAAPTVGQIADAVWDEARAGHVGAGSFGEGVASVQGNVTGSAASVTGAVGSVTGNVGGNVVGTVASVVGAVGSVTGNVGGNVTGTVGSVVGAVGSVTGNVGGNVVGSVASVTAGVTVTTNNDKTGYRMSATGVDDVWDELIAGHLGVGSTGEALNNATAAGNPWAAVVEAPYTGGDLLRIVAAVAAGKDSIVDLGGGAATVTFRDVTDASNIVVATMANSSRTAVALAP